MNSSIPKQLKVELRDFHFKTADEVFLDFGSGFLILILSDH